MSVTVCVCVMRSVLRYVALLFVAVRSVVYQGGWCTCGGVYQVALLLLPYYLSICLYYSSCYRSIFLLLLLALLVVREYVFLVSAKIVLEQNKQKVVRCQASEQASKMISACYMDMACIIYPDVISSHF